MLQSMFKLSSCLLRSLTLKSIIKLPNLVPRNTLLHARGDFSALRKVTLVSRHVTELCVSHRVLRWSPLKAQTRELPTFAVLNSNAKKDALSYLKTYCSLASTFRIIASQWTELACPEWPNS